METEIFISYAHADKEIVHPLAMELQGLQFSVWIDMQGLPPGSLWNAVIADNISKCKYFLLFISSGSISSDSVRREVQLAYDAKKAIIPVRLQKVDIPTEWKFQLAGIQWIETDNTDWKLHLVAALGRRADQAPMPVPATTISKSPAPNGAPVPVEDNRVKQEESAALIPDDILAIFRRDFVRPTECDVVSGFLRRHAKNLSLPHHDLNLQYALKSSMLAVAGRVERFRRIADPPTDETEGEKNAILSSLEKLARFSPA